MNLSCLPVATIVKFEVLAYHHPRSILMSLSYIALCNIVVFCFISVASSLLSNTKESLVIKEAEKVG